MIQDNVTNSLNETVEEKQEEEYLSYQGNKRKPAVSISVPLPISAAREEYRPGTGYLH